MRRLACPYCYESFSERAIVFRCSGRPGRRNGRACARTRDELLMRRTGLATPLPPSFHGDGRRASAHCPTCGEETSYRLCPECHSQLPVHFGKVGSRLVAMIGAKEAGKTVYMTVLLHELMHQVGARFGASVMGSDDATRTRFSADYERVLYDDRRLFPATASAGARGGRVAPLVFRFTTERRRLLGARPEHTLLSFFDAAGEDLTSQQSVDVNVRYLASADGIILLLDPLQMRGARELVAPGTRLPRLGPGTDSAVNLLSRVTDMLRARQGLRPSDRIAKPMAVAFSKVDALSHRFEQGTPLRRLPASAAEPVFDSADSLDVHEHVRSLLDHWEGSQIDQILQHHYERYRYFGLSSLGERPTPDNRVSQRGIQPYRVADPFLWLLSGFGAIPATKV